MAAQHLRKCLALMKQGVSIVDPASTFIDDQVVVGLGTVIEPFSFISGKTVIGRHCKIGPMSRIKDCRIADRVTVDQSTIEGSKLEHDSSVGPWTRLRSGCVVGAAAHLGNFCEFKKAKIGKGAKVGHLSYVGDTSIGERANIGAGTITANYDGKKKSKTSIGKRAFIGSGTILIAPVRVGDGAMTGAGAVLLKGIHVPKKGVALGVPARIVRKK